MNLKVMSFQQILFNNLQAISSRAETIRASAFFSDIFSRTFLIFSSQLRPTKNEPRHDKTGILPRRKQRHRSAHSADQRLCFHFLLHGIPLLPRSEISSFQPYSVSTQAGLCRTWFRNPDDQFSHVTAQINVEIMHYWMFKHQQEQCNT